MPSHFQRAPRTARGRRNNCSLCTTNETDHREQLRQIHGLQRSALECATDVPICGVTQRVDHFHVCIDDAAHTASATVWAEMEHDSAPKIAHPLVPNLGHGV